VDPRVADLEKNLGDLVDLVGRLNTAVKNLANRIDPPAGRDSRPSRWAWRHATADQASWLWAGLVPWVRWLVDTYPTQTRDLTPCWHQHPDAVQELTSLWAAWREAYHGTDGDRSEPAHWHDRWFPGTIHRLTGPTGILTTCAKAKAHRPPHTGGAPSRHFDDHGIPTVEEHAAADIAARPAGAPPLSGD
jgi:hypothetical protein